MRSRKYLAFATLMMVIASALTIWINIEMMQRTIEAEKQSRRLSAEETRRATCSLINAQVGVYRESPPLTSVGREVARAWEDMRIRFHCQGGS
jgi:hypothetical protein